jgi:aminoglycoside 6-adenylyltransferase
MANYECAYELRTHLLRMIEWHARAMNGPDYDTWYWGRFMERWADPRAVAALPGVFSAYDAAASRRALLATMDLFSSLARETADRMRFPYPDEAERAVSEWLRARLPAGAQP